MRAVVFCATLAVIVYPSVAGAQSLSLTESDALARLSAASPRVRAIRAELDVVGVDVLAAGRWPNPRVNWDRQSVAGVTEHLVTVSQVLPITGRRNLEMQAASARVAAMSNRIDDEARRLRADLRQAFAELQAAQVRENELITAVARLLGLAEVLAKREAAGDAAGFDRLRAEREVLDLDADRAIAATDRARAQAKLASFLGDVTDPTQIVAVRPATAPTAVPTVEALVAQAEISRGEWLALRKDRDAAELAERAAARSRVPEPEIFAGTKSSTASGGGIGSTVIIGGGDIGPVIAVHATVPLFDRARPERTLAVARAAQAEAQAAAFQQTLRGEITALRAAVVDRREGAERYRAEAVSRADDIQRIARVSYDAGERGILEVIDAYRLGTTARIRQAALDVAVSQAEIELEFVSGWEIPQ
jgi:cobalt-zinc-cadmium efflux system outer membrane protein